MRNNVENIPIRRRGEAAPRPNRIPLTKTGDLVSRPYDGSRFGGESPRIPQQVAHAQRQDGTRVAGMYLGE